MTQADLCVVALPGTATGEREHATILRELHEHLRPVFEGSPDGVYLFLNDRHKVCNEQLAPLSLPLWPAPWHGSDGDSGQDRARARHPALARPTPGWAGVRLGH